MSEKQDKLESQNIELNGTNARLKSQVRNRSAFFFCSKKKDFQALWLIMFMKLRIMLVVIVQLSAIALCSLLIVFILNKAKKS